MPIRVTVWNEFRHEIRNPRVAQVYPNGMHAEWKKAIEEHLGDRVVVRTATLDEPEHGLTDEVLNNTDVLTWWAHGAHAEVSDVVAAKVASRVRNGMGFIVLHSGHYAKPFQLLLGHARSPQVARLGRARAFVERVARPPDHARFERRLHPDRARGDVQRTLRHPAPGRTHLPELVRRRGSISQRMCLEARRGEDLLLPAGPRIVPDILSPGRPPGDREWRGLRGAGAGNDSVSRQLSARRTAARADPVESVLNADVSAG